MCDCVGNTRKEETCNICWWHWLILIFVGLIFVMFLIYLISILALIGKANKLITDFDDKIKDILNKIQEPIVYLAKKLERSGIPEKIGKGISNVVENASDIAGDVSDITRNIKQTIQR